MLEKLSWILLNMLLRAATFGNICFLTFTTYNIKWAILYGLLVFWDTTNDWLPFTWSGLAESFIRNFGLEYGNLKKSLLLFLLFPYYCHSWCLKSMTNKYYEYNFFIWRIFYGIDMIFKKNLALIGVERFLSTNLQMGPLLFFYCYTRVMMPYCIGRTFVFFV